MTGEGKQKMSIGRPAGTFGSYAPGSTGHRSSSSTTSGENGNASSTSGGNSLVSSSSAA
eukprot:GSA25T00010581001.1